MGARVTIGLVYDACSQTRIQAELRAVIGYLAGFGCVNRTKVSEDAEGSAWLVRKPGDNRELESLYVVLARGYFAEVELVGDVLRHHDLGMTVRLVKSECHFGFLLDFSEDDLLENHSEAELTEVTDDLVALMKDLHRATKYDYAFCDEEAAMEYAPKDFRSYGFREYSVAIVPSGRSKAGGLSVLKASWSVDGLTPRC